MCFTVSAERLSTFDELISMLMKDISKPVKDMYVDFLSGYLCQGEHPYFINTAIRTLTLCTITMRQVEEFELEELVEQFGVDPQTKIDFVMKVSRMELDEHMAEHPLQKEESSESPKTFEPLATSTPKRPEEIRRRVASGAVRRLF